MKFSVVQKERRPVRRRTLTVLMIVVATLVAGKASGQPLFGVETSLECSVLNSDLVFVGTISEVVEAGNRGKRDVPTVTFAVEETLKGEHRPQRALPLQHSWKLSRSLRLSMFTKWKAEESRVLVFAREGSEPATAAINLADSELAVMTADLTLLRAPEDVIQFAKETVRRLPGVTRIDTFPLIVPRDAVAGMGWESYYTTGGHVRLDVPVDAGLEKRALRNVHSESYRHRQEAARALRYFKTERNVEQMKQLLKDEEWAYSRHAERNLGIEVRDYAVRREAYETLKHWGVEVERPVFTEEVVKLEGVTVVNLSNRDVAAGDIKALTRFENLEDLYLWNSRIDDDDLEALAELKTLQTLGLGGTNVGDAAMRHVANLKNLRYLGLADTKVTDEGITVLPLLTSLEEVDLSRTAVTDDGIALLQKLLPELKVEFDD